MATLAYVRVSTEAQNEARQMEAINLYCQQHGIADYEVYKDKLSGANTNRPRLQDMLANVKSGDTVIVKDVSRLSRSLSNFIEMYEDFKKRNIRFVSLQEGFDSEQSGIMGEAMMKMMAIIAEMERNIINARVREGVALAKAEGKYKGKRAKYHDPALVKMVCEQQINGIITASKAAELLDGVSVATFYRILSKYQAGLKEV
jgi:DNA invertase Pin-like site-specific DNA recombinase